MQHSPSSLAEAVAPASSRELPPARPAPWALRTLDAFLREDQRRARPDDLSRYRVMTVTVLMLLGMSVLYFFSALAMPERTYHPQVAAGCIIVYSLVLVSVRRSRSPFFPGAFLCTVMLCIYILSALQARSPAMATHVGTTLIPLLAFFLLGPRGGLVFTLLMGMYVLVLSPLFAVQSADSLPSVNELSISGNVFAAFCIVGVWGLSSMNNRARDKAQQALEQTLKSLREGEYKLSSLVESTDDIVCSLDAQGRLLTANAAMRRWFSLLFEQEPRLGEPLSSPGFVQHHPEWPERFARALQGERMRVEAVYPQGETSLALDISLTPIIGEQGKPVGVTVFGRDVTERRQAEARLSELHRALLETSRKAGMAEIATGVLHNVGNTLTSVNISVSLLAERLRGSRVPGLLRATEMLEQNTPDLGTFLTRDEKGQRLPSYLVTVSRRLAEDQQWLLSEIDSLTKNVEHIKSVVQMQQEHARYVGIVEEVRLSELLDDALRLHANSYERWGIQVLREYDPVPPLVVDRHRLLQILVNLLSNARHALAESQHPDKQLRLRISLQPEERLRIEVKDNGIGISPEHLPRIFSHGFTTKKDGHGFGLHASALAAAEMHGRLACTSDGPGHGATFTIELPLAPPAASPGALAARGTQPR